MTPKEYLDHAVQESAQDFNDLIIYTTGSCPLKSFNSNQRL
ncbi:hypothetical protein N654_1389 [Lactiplantibacillus plantarum 4_3]|nr:hypothetical protein N654_1389 [Lactiplantibacillus plantarum 4_3]